MASTAAQTRLTPAIANSTLHSVVACGRPEVMTQVRSMVNQTPGVDVIAECSSGRKPSVPVYSETRSPIH